MGEVIENSGKTHVEHLAPNRSEELGHKEATDTGEARVLEREPGAIKSRLNPVGDNCCFGILLAGPRRMMRGPDRARGVALYLRAVAVHKDETRTVRQHRAPSWK